MTPLDTFSASDERQHLKHPPHVLLFKGFGQKTPLHLSLSHDGEEEEVKRGREYLSPLLRFVRASGISKLLLYTDLLQ